jgi:hypothetical protein
MVWPVEGPRQVLMVDIPCFAITKQTNEKSDVGVVSLECVAEGVDFLSDHVWLNLFKHRDEPGTASAAKFARVGITIDIEIQALEEKVIVIPVSRVRDDQS